MTTGESSVKCVYALVCMYVYLTCLFHISSKITKYSLGSVYFNHKSFKQKLNMYILFVTQKLKFASY